MRMEISNYIVGKLVEEGVSQAFMVTGGGAMYLDDGLGHREGPYYIYNHHEQTCTMATGAYARIHSYVAVFCVATGPGGTNAITGVAGGWPDSTPMLVLSGQVRYDTTVRWSGMGIYAMGDQEFDICKAIDRVTEYSEMVIDPIRIRYCLEKALYLTRSERPGPCWLDILLNIRGVFVETEALPGFDLTDYGAGGDGQAGKDGEHRIPEDEAGKGEHRRVLPGKADASTTYTVTDKVRAAKRPVVNVGNSIRIVRTHDVFMGVAEGLGAPVITGWDSEDVMYDTHPPYVGRTGNMGGRPGNFAIQNSDLTPSVGSRLSIRQVGYNFETRTREAYVIVNDIDEEELKKSSVRSDMRVHADAEDPLEQLNLVLDRILAEEEGSLPESVSHPGGRRVFDGGKGLRDITRSRTCAMWKEKYPVVLPKHFAHTGEEPVNMCVFTHAVNSRLKGGQVTVVGNGSAYAIGGHAYIIKGGQCFITNSVIVSMDYDLSVVTDVWTAPRDKGCYCQDGDRSGDGLTLVIGGGSIWVNLQELQTIIHHRMGIKILVISNEGYHSIRQTRGNFSGELLVGIDVDSKDLSFPALDKLVAACGRPYMSARHNGGLREVVEKTLAVGGPITCEVFVSMDQDLEPKSSTKRLSDDTIVSPLLEDLFPFLSDRGADKNMIIPKIKEQILSVNQRAGLSQGIRDEKEYILRM